MMPFPGIRVDEVSIQEEGAGMRIEVSLSWHSSMDMGLVAVTTLGALSTRVQVMLAMGIPSTDVLVQCAWRLIEDLLNEWSGSVWALLGI